MARVTGRGGGGAREEGSWLSTFKRAPWMEGIVFSCLCFMNVFGKET